MRPDLRRPTVLLASALLPMAAFATGRSSTDYQITFEALTGGGGTSSSADYAITSSFEDIGGLAASADNSIAMASGFIAQTIPLVAARQVFYNQSFFDGNNAAANASDDAAIAPDKRALLPGGTASLANYTSYSRGLNGIMVDVTELGGTPTAADFAFNIGNDNTPGAWAGAPAPTSVSVRWGAGVGGSDRVTLIWPANAIRKTWLRVATLPTANTGLGATDVFYFGNAVGETGNSGANAQVTATDALRVLANVSLTAPIDSRFDINRDGRVASADRLLVLQNLSVLQPLALINLSGSPALADAAPAPLTDVPTTSAEVRPTPTGLALRWIGNGGTARIWTADAAASGEWEIYGEIDGAGLTGETLEVVLPVDPEETTRVYRLDNLPPGSSGRP